MSEPGKVTDLRSGKSDTTYGKSREVLREPRKSRGETVTSRIRFVVETVEDCGKTVHGSFTGRSNSVSSLSRRCRAFRTVARHPHRHTGDHGTLLAGSQVSGLSTTFSGKRPLLQNFPSGKERKVFNFLEGKLSPTDIKDENS